MSKKTEPDILPPEWCHRIEVANLSGGEQRKTITASDQEAKDLARRLQVKTIEGLHADIVLQSGGAGSVIHVTGTVHARVTQPCVVTTVDVVQAIDEPFEAWYADKEAFVVLARARHDRIAKRVDAEVPMLEEHEDPEAIIDGRIDLGELAAQYLSLAVDPFPYAEGVAEKGAVEILEKHGVAAEKRNPFAALKDWKADRKRDDKH